VAGHSHRPKGGEPFEHIATVKAHGHLPTALALAHIPEKWTPISGLPDIGASIAQIGNIRFAWFSEKDMRQHMNLERIPIPLMRDAL
jgi:hypothetical protein